MARNAPASVSYQTQQRPEHVIVSGRRLDDRGCEEFRPAFLDCGSHSKAAGSAYAEFGNTKVMVGVFGPVEKYYKGFDVKGSLKCQIRRTSFCTTTRAYSKQTTAEEQEGAVALQAALEAAVQLDSFPKCLVSVHCVVMESGGSDLAVLITAASLALADAGIPMFDLVSACCISRVKGQLLLDPTLDEAFRQDGSCLLALMPSQKKVTQVVVTGEWSSGSMSALLELAMGGCMQLDTILRQTLLEGAA